MDQVATRRNILIWAVVLALVVTVLLFLYIKKATAPQKGLNVPVVVATQDIAPGAIIDDGMVEVTQKPAESVPARAFPDLTKVIGKVALVSLPVNDPIQEGQVQAKGIDLGLSYVIPSGMRAVTVALDSVIGVAGFLKYGNHVDVLATFSINEGTITKTVLQNVRLLAVNSEAQQPTVQEGTKSKEAPQTATLLVDPTDAEKLILAEAKGKLRLSLRASGDVVHVPTSGVTSRALVGFVPPDVAKPRAVAASFARPLWSETRRPISPFYSGALPSSLPAGVDLTPRKEIEVIKGSQVERVPVKT